MAEEAGKGTAGFDTLINSNVKHNDEQAKRDADTQNIVKEGMSDLAESQKTSTVDIAIKLGDASEQGTEQIVTALDETGDKLTDIKGATDPNSSSKKENLKDEDKKHKGLTKIF